MRRLRLGVDLDNTLLCWDEVFHRAAVERGLLTDGIPATKEAVRGHLRATGREEAWTALQGEVYGARTAQARPFPGALACLAAAVRRGVQVTVISHRTRQPIRGPAVDLHAAARAWLEAQGCFDPAGVGLDPAAVHLEETREAKVARIAAEGCTHFVDDLPEVLLAPGFPPATARLLFAPGGAAHAAAGLEAFGSWAALGARLEVEG